MNKNTIPLTLFKTAIIAVAAALASCATLAEPSVSVPSLVVGQAVVEAKNFDFDLGNGHTINGTSTDGINLVFTNYSTKALIKIHPDANGFFSTTLLPPGNYSITAFLFEKTVTVNNSINSYKMDIEPSSSTKFTVKPGVTNLGKVVWQADAKAGSEVLPKEAFAAIRTQFDTANPKSLWLAKPWQTVKVTRNLDFDIDNAALSANTPAPVRTSARDFRQARIEALVRTVPASVKAKQSSDPQAFVAELVGYLSKGSPSAFETVKRLHDWEADNIAYDAPSFLSGKLPDQSYQSVLKTRLAVCEGYATLFKKLCDTAGIPCALVSGYSRGYGTTLFAKEDPSDSNHAWNLVQIDHQSYLVDTTWDAGNLDAGRYNKEYSTGYLFADPAEFIHSHFPDNPQYQLLSTPVSAAEFTALPSWNAEFFSAGIVTVTPLKKVNALGNEFGLQFRVPAGVDMMGVLLDEQGQKELPDSVFRQQTGDIVSVQVALPKSGRYVLRLFEHRADDKTDEYAGCGEIGFTATADSPARLPKAYTSFVPNDKLITPLGTPLVAGKNADFKVVMPHTPLASVVIGKTFNTMTRDPATGTFTATVLIPQDATSVSIVQSRNSGNSWESVLDFPVSR